MSKKVVDNKLFSIMKIEELRYPHVVLNLDNDTYGGDRYVVISKSRTQIDRLTNALANTDSANINFDIMQSPFIEWVDKFGDSYSFIPTTGTYIVDYDIIRSVVDENKLHVEIAALRTYATAHYDLSPILKFHINELEKQICEFQTIDDPDYSILPYGEYDKVCTSCVTFSNFVLDAMML